MDAIAEPSPSEPAHLERRFVMRAPALPERVFPLLCPVREHEWVDGWAAEVVHSESGVAELGCVFRTGPLVWAVHAYEPPARIGFTVFHPGCFVERLEVTLAPDGGETVLSWRRVTTALAAEGRHAIVARAEGWDGAHAYLERALAHHLRTGGLLAR